MNIFEKICIFITIPVGIVFMLLGALGLFIGCSFDFTLPPVMGVLPFLVGYAMCVCLIKYMSLGKQQNCNKPNDWSLRNHVGIANDTQNMEKESKNCVNGMFLVDTYPSRLEAESASSMLESEGITSFVLADDCGGARPDMNIATGGAKLLVGTYADLKKARELLGNH